MLRFVLSTILVAASCNAAATTQQRARELMGVDFIGIQEAERAMGVKLTVEQRNALSTVPYSEATLKASKGTHVLLPGIPVTADHVMYLAAKDDVRVEDYVNAFYAGLRDGKYSAIKIAQMIDSNTFKDVFFYWARTGGESGVRQKKWYDTFTKPRVRWFLFRKQIIDPAVAKECGDSLRKADKLAGSVFKNHYERPNLAEALYAFILVRIAKGATMYDSASATTADRIPELGYPIWIGFHKDVLVISNTWMYYASGCNDRPRLGDATIRKTD